MSQTSMTRRAALATGAAMIAGAVAPAFAQAAPAIHVIKDPNCGCCSAWIDILEAEGFRVTTENAVGAALMQAKQAAGIPPALASCHTALIEGYAIEGHVPVADIRRLLSERPDAVALSVPGMPIGSPGMGPDDRREAYDVMLIRRDGSASIFSSYPAAA